ncbi:hypothetical protein BCV69DRAFT_16401 [Microstroma glucosiphilum]|uniref:Transmembrane protein n=1 Tax=Pseudomicrostroma glucosiphilum TaxID=1684307 RepID=A0A316UGG4_9BASI|nr:hypothetical protein BCV69DRAFT_16401 [Pseudomicrostroma glucosiphilum]PWN23994.1 hypothetical protein BCV69DRAFT_16401 [Pseudomicrostroma glucosiphilum]
MTTLHPIQPRLNATHSQPSRCSFKSDLCPLFVTLASLRFLFYRIALVCSCSLPFPSLVALYLHPFFFPPSELDPRSISTLALALALESLLALLVRSVAQPPPSPNLTSSRSLLFHSTSIPLLFCLVSSMSLSLPVFFFPISHAPLFFFLSLTHTFTKSK